MAAGRRSVQFEVWPLPPELSTSGAQRAVAAANSAPGARASAAGDGGVTRHPVLPKDAHKAREHLMRAAEAHQARAYEKARWGIPQDY